MIAPKKTPPTEGLDSADISSARRLFKLEADGITALAETIDHNFSAALQIPTVVKKVHMINTILLKKLMSDAFNKSLSINILHSVESGSQDSSFHLIR